MAGAVPVTGLCAGAHPGRAGGALQWPWPAPGPQGGAHQMAGKCALIVDDSRLAREVLGRMLAQHGLRVEMAESAEAALAFLAAQRPDVIFMDHMMPGMDGFEAVRAIKQNPATATIPVMMYTSQSGDLYVGQARALGAVGVLPKQIRPVEVAEVLHSLHLTGEATADARHMAAPAPLPGAEVAMQPADWSDLHRWLQKMLGDHSRSLRSDLEAGIGRILAERLPPLRPVWPLRLLIVALAVVAAVFFLLHLDAQSRWQAASRQNLELMAALDRQRAGAAAAPAAGAAETPLPADIPDAVIAALEWGVNQSPAYAAGDMPFDDARAVQLAALLRQLRALGFRGTVRLEAHVGDFCMVRTGDGDYALAGDDLPVPRCDRLGWPPAEAVELAGRQSVAFANAIAAAAAADDGIRIEIEPVGNGRPRVAYPPAAAGSVAVEWNRAAQANQRVELHLVAAPAMVR